MREYTLGYKKKTMQEKLDNREESINKIEKWLKNRTDVLNLAEYFKDPQNMNQKSTLSLNPNDYATFSKNKIDENLLKSSKRMNQTAKKTSEARKEWLKNELESLLQQFNSASPPEETKGLADKEIVDAIACPNLSTMHRLCTNIRYEEILMSELESESTVKDNLESIDTKQEVEVSRFHQKIKNSTLMQAKLKSKIDRENEELAHLYNKLEDSSWYGKVLVSKDYIVSKDYHTLKNLLQKNNEDRTREAFDQQEMDIYRIIWSKIFNYKIKLTSTYGLLNEQYFEFYEDEHCSKSILRLPREDIDVVSLGIRILSKQEEPSPFNKNKKKVPKRRTRLYTDHSDSRKRKISDDSDNLSSLSNKKSNGRP